MEESNVRLSERQFVKRWCQAAKAGKSLGELVQSLRLPYGEIYGRFRAASAKGVDLPRLRGQRHDHQRDAVELNKIILQVMAGKTVEPKQR